ncbi:34796_t:CDS:2 [Racocetra persica]|uniref:34796_t:CDS:1 n=1 Tax=Racocetra persica TaxID=160502 RepID=A0ACA9RIQ4_9GLOM|nr:34796_t:CDS:2 [Racocetra persica]
MNQPSITIDPDEDKDLKAEGYQFPYKKQKHVSPPKDTPRVSYGKISRPNCVYQTWSQPLWRYRGSSFALVKSITINSRSCKFLSSISTTLCHFFVYRRAMLTSSS